MTFLPWLTVLWDWEWVVLDHVMLADLGHLTAKAVLIVVVDVAAGPAKWDRAKPTPKVSGRAGRLRGTTHDGDEKSGRKGLELMENEELEFS